MRVLLDECVNPRVKAAFKDHEAKTVVDMAWMGIGNGELLTLAEKSGFDVFVTVDQNLRHQQNLAARKIGFIVVKVPDNNIKYYRPIFKDLLKAAEMVKAGEVIFIAGSDQPV